MSNNRKEEIVLATIKLAAEYGLFSVSMSMIAEKVGIKKPSLYKHFASKEEIVEAVYEQIRNQAKENSSTVAIDYSALFQGKDALEILQKMVDGYIHMNRQEQMYDFYKVIYAERSIQPVAARIMAEETERMILATKQLFYAMEVHKKLHFRNADMSAVSFAMTIHGLMEYALDRRALNDKAEDRRLINDYLQWFCEENAIEEGKADIQ